MKETFGEKLMIYFIAGITFIVILILYPLEYLENCTKWSEYRDIYLK